MKVSRAALGALLVALLGAVAVHASVLKLDKSSFDHVVTESDFIAVEFFAPWCGHCKRLEPEWAAAAETFANSPPAGLDVEVKLAAVDATAETELATKYGIRGYPTIKIFRNGDLENPQEYQGPREKAGIISYLSTMAGPAVMRVASETEAADLFGSSNIIVFAVGDDLLSAVEPIAESRRGGAVKFAHVANASIVEAIAGSIDGASLVAVRKFDSPVVPYFGTASGIAAFVDEVATPSVIMLSSDPIYEAALQKAFSTQEPKVLVFADEWSQESAEALREATATLKGRADVIGADIKEAARAASFFGVEEMAMPVMTAHAPRTNAKYVEKADAVDASAIIAFGEAVVAGTLEPYVKSEPVPTSDDGPVKVVVAKTFDEVVMSGRDVMIEFYAPWCGHCQRLAPTYEELAQWAHASTNVLVAKMDATANDVVNPKFDVKGFPTIYFVQGESGRVLPYEGERTLEALKDFILDNASTFDEL